MTIRIWLGSLAAYNEGRLVGEWLELPMDEDALREKYNKYTDNGRHDHYIADWECDIGGLVSDYADPFMLNELAETLTGMDESDVARVGFLVEYQGYKPDDALDKYEDVDYYPGMTLKALAYQFVDEGLFGEIPDAIAGYLDYDAIARDLGFEYTETPDGVFRCD